MKRAEAMCEESHAEARERARVLVHLAGARTLLPPPRWKMAVVSGSAVWTLGMVLGPVIRAPLGFLPAPVVSLITVAVTVVLLTWVVMPQLTRLLRKWLFVETR